MPSDFAGIVAEDFDGGGWRQKLAAEPRVACFAVRLKAIVRSWSTKVAASYRRWRRIPAAVGGPFRETARYAKAPPPPSNAVKSIAYIFNCSPTRRRNWCAWRRSNSSGYARQNKPKRNSSRPRKQSLP
jgi:hypothetical protein